MNNEITRLDALHTAPNSNEAATARQRGRDLAYPACCIGAAMSCAIFLTLSGCGGGGDDGPSPSIQFTANKTTINPGEPVVLSWQVTGGKAVSISGVTGTPGAQVIVAPAATTTYILTAANDAGTRSIQELTVSVNAASPFASVAVDASKPGTAISREFLGFSIPPGQAQLTFGDPAVGINPIFRQFVRNLADASGGKPITMRIGGGFADSTQTPNSGTVRAFAQFYLDMQKDGYSTPFIFGLNFRAPSQTLVLAQAQQYVGDMPAGSIVALQLGNEPDLGYARTRPQQPYDMNAYTAEFKTYASMVNSQVAGSPPFIAPSTAFFPLDPYPTQVGAAQGWLTEPGLTNLIQQAGPLLSYVGQHSYGYVGSARTGTMIPKGTLLTPDASERLPAWAAPFVKIAQAQGKKYRLDEMNSIAGEGEDGVSNAFEASLWAPDILFEYAKIGVTGVNLITKNWNTLAKWDPYAAFQFNVPESQYNNLANIALTTFPLPPDLVWPADGQYSIRTVQGLYYGMLLFANATAGDAKLLPTSVSTSRNVKVWSTIDQASGRVTVLILNKDHTASGTVEILIPGYASGVVQRMRAPHFDALSGITLAGQTFDGSKDGKPVGTKYGEQVTAQQNGRFTVAVEPTSAALISLSK